MGGDLEGGICAIFLSFVIIIISGCSQNDVDLPISDEKPTLLIFCDSAVSCLDLGYITPELEQEFSESSISIGYLVADNEIGANIIESVEIILLPSYVIFNTDKQEIARHEGEIEVEELIAIFSELLSE